MTESEESEEELVTMRSGRANTLVLVVAFVLAWRLSSPTAQEPSAATAWQAARTPDWQPDIQGVWGSADGGIFSLQLEPVAHLRTIGMPQGGGPIVSDQGDVFVKPTKTTIVVDPPSGVLPHQPWALERRNSVMKEYVSPAP